jgi:hypothetical protein
MSLRIASILACLALSACGSAGEESGSGGDEKSDEVSFCVQDVVACRAVWDEGDLLCNGDDDCEKARQQELSDCWFELDDSSCADTRLSDVCEEQKELRVAECDMAATDCLMNECVDQESEGQPELCEEICILDQDLCDLRESIVRQTCTDASLRIIEKHLDSL